MAAGGELGLGERAVRWGRWRGSRRRGRRRAAARARAWRGTIGPSRVTRQGAVSDGAAERGRGGSRRGRRRRARRTTRGSVEAQVGLGAHAEGGAVGRGGGRGSNASGGIAVDEQVGAAWRRRWRRTARRGRCRVAACSAVEAGEIGQHDGRFRRVGVEGSSSSARASRVVPGAASVTARARPSRALKRVDLPAARRADEGGDRALRRVASDGVVRRASRSMSSAQRGAASS
jgi:hypothetical protein